MISPEEVEVHIAAWVAGPGNGKERGFNAHNYKRYNFSNESGLRRWLGRNRLQQGSSSSTNQAIYRPSKASKNRRNKRYNGNTQSLQRKLGKYNHERNPPTGQVSTLDNHDWLIKFDVTYTWDRTEERDEIIEFLWTKSGLTVIHRGFGKSKIQWGLITRKILELGWSRLEITDGKRQAKKIYKKVKGLLHRKEIREFYGDVIEGFDGSELTMELVDPIDDDPSLTVATRGGSIIGMHPREIGIHDFLQRKFKSDESEEDLRDWWDEVASYLRTYEIQKVTRIVGVITRKGPDDLYSYMFSKGLKQYHRLAIEKLSGRWAESLEDFVIDDDGLPTALTSEFGTFKTLHCPNWPLHALLFERFTNYHAFEQQMQGRIVPKEGNYFHLEDWEASIVDLPLLEYGSSAMEEFTDPAFGESGKGSESALGVFTWYMGEMHIIQLKVGHFGTTKQEVEACKLHADYGCISIHLEDNFAQMSRAYDRNSPIMKLKGMRLFHQKDLPGGIGDTGKAQRINHIQKPYRTRRIKLHRDCNQQDDFKKQFLNYRGLVSKRESWDILDLVATAYNYLSKKHGSDRKGKLNQSGWGKRFE